MNQSSRILNKNMNYIAHFYINACPRKARLTSLV